MENFNWHKIKFLESSSNLKSLIKESTGRTLSTRVAREISICIQQGRMFFETASKSPMETRPLQLFYGMVGFSKALTIAKTIQPLESLSQSHGLKDISEQNSKLENLSVKVERKGTFQQFNDIVSPLSRVCFFEENSSPVATYVPCATSKDTNNIILNLKDILSRIPGLEKSYQNTFSEAANSHLLGIHFWYEYNDYCQLRVDDPEIFTDRQSLKNLVNRFRNKYPFLSNWRIESASQAWGNSIIHFGNVEIDGIDEFSDENLIERDGKFDSKSDFMRSTSIKRTNFINLFSPLTGGYSNSSSNMVAPINNLYISEFSLQYIGMFLLSSVVRYRPHTWVNSITGYSTENSASDDRALALIEQFMGLCSNGFPILITAAINHHEDRYSLTRRSS